MKKKMIILIALLILVIGIGAAVHPKALPGITIGGMTVLLAGVSGLTAPTNGISMNQKKLVYRLKAHAYYSLGAFDPTDIPANKAAFTALYSGGTPKFKPLGDLSKDPIEITWEREKLDTHTGSSRGALNVQGTIKSLALLPDTITLLDSNELDDQISILLVPFSIPAAPSATDPVKVLALSGVMLIDKGSANGNGKFGEVDFGLTATPDKLGDCIILRNLTA